MEYYLCPFTEFYREQAVKECRVLHALNVEGLPPDDYALFESYCIDPNCDCRRVMLNVVSKKSGRCLASISFGFDREDEMAGPYLDPLNPQSQYANKLLELIEAWVLSDPKYVARLESHYQQVKKAVAHPTPAVRKIMRRYQDTGN